MIHTKNCENLLKFVKVTVKILSVPYFPDTMYITTLQQVVNKCIYLAFPYVTLPKWGRYPKQQSAEAAC